MWPYWLLLLWPAFLAISRLRSSQLVLLTVGRARWPDRWLAFFISLVLMIGLRHEVGGDWLTYLQMLDSYTDITNSQEFVFQDPAFVLFNWLAAQTGLGIYLLNFLSAVVFSWGLMVFCRAQPRSWLAVVVAVPYLITVVGMGYTRQGAAIGIAMVGMVALGAGGTWRFILWIALAALFHKSAVILLPMAFLANTKRHMAQFAGMAPVVLTLYALLLQESMSFWIYGYIESQYQSSGAAIRIAMNALPGALFVVFCKRFQLSREQRIFWTWMAWGSLFFVVLLIISPSSTAVDRVALYWIPLQLFVLSRLPDALGQIGGKNAGWVYVVVAYSAAVHFVWLVYADTAFAWLPYQFYPWVWLWQ